MLKKIAVLMAASLPCALWAADPALTGYISMQRVQTGWAVDMIAVIPVVPAGGNAATVASTNPAGCPTLDGYMVDSTEPGYKAHSNAVWMAFSSGKKVELVISGTACTASRPKIIGVTLSKDQ